MRANRGRDTKPEVALRSAVHALGLRYKVAARPLKELRRTADLVFPRERVAVFMDGCFWHGCSEHHTTAVTNAKYWADKVAKNRSRDDEADLLLRQAGWTSIRVWEHQDPCEAAASVRSVVLSRRSALSDK